MSITISREGQIIEPEPQMSQKQRELLMAAAFRAYLRRHPDMISTMENEVKEDAKA